MRLALVAGCLAMGLAAGCAHSVASGAHLPVLGDTSGELSIHGQGAFYGVAVNRHGMTGAQFQVLRTAEELRGEAFRRTVFISLYPQEDRAAGLLGSTPFKIQVHNTPGGLHSQGLVGGYVSDYLTSPRAIRGTIGPCSYDLVFNGSAYQGNRACAGGIEYFTLEVPAELGAWSDLELATGLGLFLSIPSGHLAQRGSGRSPNFAVAPPGGFPRQHKG